MKSILLCITLLFTGCATIHPGSEAHTLNNKTNIPLKLSAEFVENEGSDAYSVIVVTFENLSDHWLRLQGSEVLITPSATDSLSVVVGHDLLDWADAKIEEIKISQHNKQVVEASLAAAGTLASGIAKGSNGNTNTVSDIGDLTALGGISYAVLDTINTSRRTAINGSWIPDHHINEKVSIPAKMFQRRWLLVNKPIGRIVSKLALRVKTIEGESNDYIVDIK